MRLMDQLGLAADVVEVATLKRWSCIAPQNHITDYSGSGIDDCKHSSSPFPYDMLVNQKLILWVGDISQLNVDAIVNSTNESMTERNTISDRIFSKAGPGLREEITHDVKECRTGEVRVTQGYNLPARFVVHTVGPKYNVKYQTAAENTLHLCYRTVLQKACELGLSSIAIGVVNSVRRNYPPDEGAHIALRTVRRFLEQPDSPLETVVLVVQGVDVGIYEVLVPLYFPRSPLEEEDARWRLPPDTGGADGEAVRPDRLIRIIDNPQHAAGQGDDSTTQLENALSISSHAFCEMQGDLDKQRLLGERPTGDPLDEFIIKEMQSKERYERLLRRAKKEDLSEVSGIGCLYQSGFDRKGRPVIVFVGKWFRFREVNLDTALLYLISLLDPLVKGDYAIAYFHTLTSGANHPSLSWLREVYNVLPYKYKKHLKAFYIVHPTFWTKMVTWWFTTFMAPAIKQKVHSLPGVEHLYSMMAPDQLEIPAFITEYDMSLNGLRYFHPVAPT